MYHLRFFFRPLFYQFILLACTSICLLAQPADPAMSLPWTIGETWWLHHGAHHSYGTVGPLSSLDFAPAPGSSWAVRAARGGWVVNMTGCNDAVQVMLRHGDGWYSSYYHLEDIPDKIRNPVGNVWISRGEFIGNVEEDEALAQPCGNDSWDRPHVHFTLRLGTSSTASDYGNLVGKKVGGWEVLNGENRKGGLRKEGYTIYRPSSYNNYAATSAIYNDGSIGTGDFNTYNVCRDHTVYDSFGYGEQIPITVNRDMYISGQFQYGSSAKLRAGRRAVFLPGSGISKYANVSIKTYTFTCVEQDGPYLQEAPPKVTSPHTNIPPAEISVRISPNPFQHFFHLEWVSTPGAGLMGIDIIDINGKLIQQNHWPRQIEQSGSRRINLDQASELPAGIYLVRLQLENQQTVVHKIVKQ